MYKCTLYTFWHYPVSCLIVFHSFPWWKDTLAPPIKQKARFKIKDAKCHLRPRNKEKHRDSSKQNLQGKEVLTQSIVLDLQHLGSVLKRPPFKHTTIYNLHLTNRLKKVHLHHTIITIHFCFFHLEGGQFPCTDNCQVTFVNFKCDSSKKRRRGRKSPSKEVSHITAEFEMEMKEEEASGGIFFLTCLV